MSNTVRARGTASIAQLLAGATARRPYRTVDSLSGNRMEQVEFGDSNFVLKLLNAEDDWLMRATGDTGVRQATLFGSGVLDSLPDCIDHAVCGAAADTNSTGHAVTALLMRDVSRNLIPPGNGVVPLGTHRRLLDHMAAMHAAFWGWTDRVGLLPLARHYTFLGPDMAHQEVQRGDAAAVPLAVAEGWRRLLAVSPIAGRLAADLASNPEPLVAALRVTPHTLVHGDWKFGNLGEHDDGRTILLDWDRTGAAPATLDLAWYLAVNCERLPESKDASIAAYATALRQYGIDTAEWWDRQLRLALLGAFVQLGWSKAAGDSGELGWWEARAIEGARDLA
jgi:hypothetical protein